MSSATKVRRISNWWEQFATDLGAPLRRCGRALRPVQVRSIAGHHLALTASLLRMKPGGLPCLERTSSQSPVDPTTLTRLPLGMVPTCREFADGSSKTAVLRTVSYKRGSREPFRSAGRLSSRLGLLTLRWGARLDLTDSSVPDCNEASLFALSSISRWSLATRSSISLIFSSCWRSAKESPPSLVQKAFHARKPSRARTITPTEIQRVFPVGTICQKVFLSLMVRS